MAVCSVQCVRNLMRPLSEQVAYLINNINLQMLISPTTEKQSFSIVISEPKKLADFLLQEKLRKL